MNLVYVLQMHENYGDYSYVAGVYANGDDATAAGEELLKEDEDGFCEYGHFHVKAMPVIA